MTPEELLRRLEIEAIPDGTFGGARPAPSPRAVARRRARAVAKACRPGSEPEPRHEGPDDEAEHDDEGARPHPDAVRNDTKDTSP